MRKIKRPKIGEYVLVTRWGDKDPEDPWYVGYIYEIRERRGEMTYMVEGSAREWRHCFRITPDEGKTWLERENRT